MSEQPDAELGRRIRTLRERRGLSLRALAEDCGLSVNAISRIERGATSPNLASLRALATALGVMVIDFFEQQDQQMVVYVRHDRRHRAYVEGGVVESLGRGLSNQSFEPVLMTLEPGVGSDSSAVQHPGQEFIFCMSGRLEVRIGDRIYWLEAGDSLLFDAIQAHAMYNKTSQPVTILYIIEDRGTNGATQDHHLT